MSARSCVFFILSLDRFSHGFHIIQLALLRLFPCINRVCPSRRVSEGTVRKTTKTMRLLPHDLLPIQLTKFERRLRPIFHVSCGVLDWREFGQNSTTVSMISTIRKKKHDESVVERYSCSAWRCAWMITGGGWSLPRSVVDRAWAAAYDNSTYQRNSESWRLQLRYHPTGDHVQSGSLLHWHRSATRCKAQPCFSLFASVK